MLRMPIRATRPVAGFALSLFTALPGAVWGQTDQLPSGREVIDRYIEALGGRDAIRAQGGRHAWGKFSIPAQGLSGDLEVFAAPPNKLRVKLTIPGIGDVLSGYDGTTGWGINPMMGPMLVDSLELQQMEQQADFYSNLYGPEQIADLETVAMTTFEGAQCYKVQVKTAWGEEYVEYFGVDTGLLVGSERTQASRMGSVDVVTVVGDWREIDGMKVPFKSTQRTMGIENVATIDSVRIATMADSVFALPPEIQALVKQ